MKIKILIALFLITSNYLFSNKLVASVNSQEVFLNLKYKTIMDSFKARYSDNINLLENKLVLANESNKKLLESIEWLEKANENQKTFINIFEVIFGGISLLGLFSYFFSVRPILNQSRQTLLLANQANDNLSQRLQLLNDTIDQRIENRFNNYEATKNQLFLDELFRDIQHGLTAQKQNAIEKVAFIEKMDIDSNRLEIIFNTLNQENLTHEQKRILTEVLIDKGGDQVKRFFASWKNIRVDEFTLKNTLITYFMNTGFDSFLPVLTDLIINRVTQYKEFNSILDMLPSHPEDFYKLINYKPLVNSLESDSRKKVKIHINNSLKTWTTIEKDRVIKSNLYLD